MKTAYWLSIFLIFFSILGAEEETLDILFRGDGYACSI
jgi:hypothetical protein